MGARGAAHADRGNIRAPTDADRLDLVERVDHDDRPSASTATRSQIAYRRVEVVRDQEHGQAQRLLQRADQVGRTRPRRSGRGPAVGSSRNSSGGSSASARARPGALAHAAGQLRRAACCTASARQAGELDLQQRQFVAQRSGGIGRGTPSAAPARSRRTVSDENSAPSWNSTPVLRSIVRAQRPRRRCARRRRALRSRRASGRAQAEDRTHQHRLAGARAADHAEDLAAAARRGRGPRARPARRSGCVRPRTRDDDVVFGDGAVIRSISMNQIANERVEHDHQRDRLHDAGGRAFARPTARVPSTCRPSRQPISADHEREHRRLRQADQEMPHFDRLVHARQVHAAAGCRGRRRRPIRPPSRPDDHRDEGRAAAASPAARARAASPAGRSGPGPACGSHRPPRGSASRRSAR